MSKSQTKDLLTFIKPFGKEIVDKVLWLREFIWDQYPQTNELIYDNYNAVAVGWSPTDRVGHTFCSIAVGRSSKNIHFGFYWGSEISDPKKVLIGEGNQYRYILVKKPEDFPKEYILTLMKDAYENSMSKIGDRTILVHGLTVTKSVSDKKRGEKMAIKKTKDERLKTKVKVSEKPKAKSVKLKAPEKLKAKSLKTKVKGSQSTRISPPNKVKKATKKKK